MHQTWSMSRLQGIEEEDIDPFDEITEQKTTLLERMLLTFKLTPMRRGTRL